jgi:hypothetical protein
MQKLAIAISESLGPVLLMEFVEEPDDGESFGNYSIECVAVYPNTHWHQDAQTMLIPKLSLVVPSFWEDQTVAMEFGKNLRGYSIPVLPTEFGSVKVKLPNAQSEYEVFDIPDISRVILLQHAEHGTVHHHTETVRLIEHLGIAGGSNEYLEGFTEMRGMFESAIARLDAFRQRCDEVGFSADDAVWRYGMDANEHLNYTVMGRVHGLPKDALIRLLQDRIAENLASHESTFDLKATKAKLLAQLSQVEIDIKNKQA